VRVASLSGGCVSERFSFVLRSGWSNFSRWSQWLDGLLRDRRQSASDQPLAGVPLLPLTALIQELRYEDRRSGSPRGSDCTVPLTTDENVAGIFS
jgi:hypothetical protein